MTALELSNTTHKLKNTTICGAQSKLVYLQMKNPCFFYCQLFYKQRKMVEKL